MGFTVAILELSIVQRDMMQWIISLAEDWWASRVAHMDFLSSYSNFSMIQCASAEFYYVLEEVSSKVAAEFGSEPPEKARKVGGDLLPRPPSVPPPIASAPSSASGSRHAASVARPTLPAPPAHQDLDDSLIDGESWSIIADYGIDAQAVLQLKRLAAVDLSEVHRVLRKLQTKTDIEKPSQFASVAARNALNKLTGK